jgi:hypothetical protein
MVGDGGEPGRGRGGPDGGEERAELVSGPDLDGLGLAACRPLRLGGRVGSEQLLDVHAPRERGAGLVEDLEATSSRAPRRSTGCMDQTRWPGSGNLPLLHAPN